MRVFKLIGALIMVLAFTAVATATASAAETLWKWLPGAAGTTFTAHSEKATLQVKGGASITCAKSEILPKEGELTEPNPDATLALAVIHFFTCTTGGLAFNTLGDASGVLLVHVEIHNCLIKKEHFGILIKVLPIHIEVPATKLLITIEGSFIGLIESAEKQPAKHWLINLTQTAGLQTIELCEGGSKDNLSTTIDGIGPTESGLEIKGFLKLFPIAQTAELV